MPCSTRQVLGHQLASCFLGRFKTHNYSPIWSISIDGKRSHSNPYQSLQMPTFTFIDDVRHVLHWNPDFWNDFFPKSHDIYIYRPWFSPHFPMNFPFHRRHPKAWTATRPTAQRPSPSAATPAPRCRWRCHMRTWGHRDVVAISDFFRGHPWKLGLLRTSPSNIFVGDCIDCLDDV